MAVVGIDLGTTNTVVGIARDGQVRAIRDPDGEYLIPSVVSFHPSGNILVGRAAKERRVIDAANTIYSIKRLIGRSWNSEEVAHARARFPFEMREGPGQAALVVARTETFTLPEISAFVLRHAKAVAEKSLGEPVERAVITVPANFNDLQRAATKVAGRVAGLEVLRILNEPTAAALAYGYGKGKGERIAIYDFGGGTFDVTLLDLSGNVFEVLATAGNTFLGGDDVDVAIAERMANSCLERHRVDARADAQIFERLRYYAEQLKVELSSATEATIDVPDIGHDASGRPIRFSFAMTRAELDALAEPMVARTFEVCQEAMSVARLTPEKFDQVVLVGGSTRLPIVRHRVLEHFHREPLDRINPDEVVAIGAAIQANALTGQEKRRSVIPRPPMPAARAGDDRKSQPPARARSTNPFSPSPQGLARPSDAKVDDPSAGQRRRVITGMGLGPSRSSRPPPLPERKGASKKRGGTWGGVGGPSPSLPKPGQTLPEGSGHRAPTFDEDRKSEGLRRTISSRPGALDEPGKPISSRPDAHEAPRKRMGSRPDATESRFDLADEPLTAPIDRGFDLPTPTVPILPDDEMTTVGSAPLGGVNHEAPTLDGSWGAVPEEDGSDDEVTSADLRFDKLRLPALPPAKTDLGGTRVGLAPPIEVTSPKAGASATPRGASETNGVDDQPKAGSQGPIGVPSRPHPTRSGPAANEPPADLGFARTTMPETPLIARGQAALPVKPPLEPRIERNAATFTSATPDAHRLSFSEAPVSPRPVLPLLVDVTPLSLCVETVRGFHDVIIARNTPVPCEQSRTFVTATHGQETVLVRVGQGEGSRFAENTLLGEVELSGLRQATRGEVHIVVTFSLDTDGVLNVKAADAETGKAATARLKLVGLPDAEEVGRMTARHLQRTL